MYKMTSIHCLKWTSSFSVGKTSRVAEREQYDKFHNEILTETFEKYLRVCIIERYFRQNPKVSRIHNVICILLYTETR